VSDDDGYGRAWEYRVFSQLDTEPDAPNSGGRYLTIRIVWPSFAGGHRCLPLYPTPDDVAVIDHKPHTPSGASSEELMLDIERMIKACDKPALILAEWKDRESIPVRVQTGKVDAAGTSGA
jgi:hypothetical protein